MLCRTPNSTNTLPISVPCSFWQIFPTASIFAPLLVPLIWSKFWALPKLITAFLLRLWLEAGINITTELSCISNSLVYWQWMILPLSEENHKSLKFSSHPLFFSLIMQCLWPVSSSATTDSHTAGTEALTALTSLALASPFTFPAITFVSQMLSVFKYTPGACQSRFFFCQYSTSSSHFLASSWITFPWL